jgi:hypothetical protein
MRTIATFRSSAFNVSEPKPYFINPGCFGDDLAQWLIQRLRAAGVTTDDRPGQEDFGWYFNFVVPEGPHTCVIGLRPGDDENESEWVLWTERRRGLLGSLVGGRRRGISSAAVRILHTALSAAPEVTGLRWHEARDFDAGREGSAAPEP